MSPKRFNMHKYLDDQVWQAFLCPINRHFTRLEHNCDDWELFKNPQWLIDHFIKHGGAEKFAERRADYELEDIQCDVSLAEKTSL